MSDIGSMVADLIAAGCPPETAARVVAQAFVAGVASSPVRVTSADCHVTDADESVTRRRETDRLRKQKWRDRHDLSRDSRDQSRDVTSASLSKEDKKEEIKEEVGARQRSVRGQRLPDDWQPTADDMASAHELIGADRSRAELEKFKDHWKQQPGSKGVKLDWAAAWRNWIRRAAEYGGTKNGHRSVNAPRRSANSDFFAGIAGVAADIAGHDPAPRNADPEIPRGRFEIDG